MDLLTGMLGDLAVDGGREACRMMNVGLFTYGADRVKNWLH